MLVRSECTCFCRDTCFHWCSPLVRQVNSPALTACTRRRLSNLVLSKILTSYLGGPALSQDRSCWTKSRQSFAGAGWAPARLMSQLLCFLRQQVEWPSPPPCNPALTVSGGILHAYQTVSMVLWSHKETTFPSFPCS